MKEPAWNRCDVCGRFIPYADFPKKATRTLDKPDSDYSSESYTTLCGKHSRPPACRRSS